MGDQLGKGDRIFDWSGAIGIKSSAVGWVVVAVASGNKEEIEGEVR
jgi:hypothetical protein